MAQLYTIRMIAKKIISLFDSAGRKTGERTDHIPLAYSDLPHSTALSYQRQFPDNQVQIIPQAVEHGGSREGHRGAAEYNRGPQKWPKDLNRKVAQKQVEQRDELQNAAQTGNMAAAINAELNR